MRAELKGTDWWIDRMGEGDGWFEGRKTFLASLNGEWLQTMLWGASVLQTCLLSHSSILFNKDRKGETEPQERNRITRHSPIIWGPQTSQWTLSQYLQGIRSRTLGFREPKNYICSCGGSNTSRCDQELAAQTRSDFWLCLEGPVVGSASADTEIRDANPADKEGRLIQLRLQAV